MNQHIQQEKLPTIGVAALMDPWLRAEASARGWRILNLWYTGYLMAPGITLQGIVSRTPLSEEIWSLHQQGVPVVRLGQMSGPDDGVIPAVLFDMAAEGRLAAEHFFERGFRDVGFFGMDPWSDGQILFEGFRDRARELEMNCHLFRMKHPSAQKEQLHRQKEKQLAFSEWLRNAPKPIGLLALGGWFAASYCSWTMQAGFKVPDDVAVIGVDCDPVSCEYSAPTITTVDRAEQQRSRAACQLLARRMDGQPPPATPVWIQPQGITERESTNVLATPDRVVAEALRYLWDHLDADFDVEVVAQQVGVSSRQLARRFQKVLNRTVTAELRRKRLEQAKRLLRTTDLLIADIAVMVGFRSNTYLHQTFRSEFGVTPAKYRRKEKGVLNTQIPKDPNTQRGRERLKPET